MTMPNIVDRIMERTEPIHRDFLAALFPFLDPETDMEKLAEVTGDYGGRLIEAVMLETAEGMGQALTDS